jgi:hypothetical protein
MLGIAMAFVFLSVSRNESRSRSKRTACRAQRGLLSYRSHCKLWLNLGRGHGSPAERKMAMVIDRPLLKLSASTRGPRS